MTKVLPGRAALTDEEKLAAVDGIWRDMATRPPREHAQRRWIRPQVVAVPGDDE
ncbi:hypothetical protein AB0B94_20850 [Micromonospora sp. NPDC048986]|uniref:hypothetical protein n=1 Tax=Micromonospora sp. NPDC048986 TaxID=3155644 RepID=UPI0033D61066